MNFLITNQKNRNFKDFKFKLKLTKKYSIFSDDKLKIFKIKNQVIIFDGRIFGYNRDKFINLNQNKLGNYLNNKNLFKNLDGDYCIIKISKDKIHFNIDNKGSYDLFYTNNKKSISFSNNFKLIKDLNHNNLTFDNFAILNAISNVSKRPPLKNTIFNEIKRID